MKTLIELLAVPRYRALAILIGTIFAAIIVERIVNRGLMRLAKRTKTELDDEIVALARRPIFFTMTGAPDCT